MGTFVARAYTSLLVLRADIDISIGRGMSVDPHQLARLLHSVNRGDDGRPFERHFEHPGIVIAG